MFSKFSSLIAALALGAACAAQGATLDLGGNTACAIKDGGVQCWGYNYFGQLGDGTTDRRSEPAWVKSLEAGAGATDVSVSDHGACAVVAGDVICWGSGYVVTTPRLSADLWGPVQQVSLAGSHGCVVVAGGAACWGWNTEGQIGTGVAADLYFPPTPVSGLEPGSGAGVTQVAVGSQFSCAVVKGGVRCWGLGAGGQLGNGDVKNQATPQDVAGLAPSLANPSVLSIAVADASACARLSNATVRCWGSGYYGELGDGAAGVKSSPVQVLVDGSQTPLGFVSYLGAGRNHYCASLVSGTMACWGYNFYGQLGSGSVVTQTKAKSVPIPPGLKALAPSGGSVTTCANFDDDGVRCWGSNLYGTLGLGDDAVERVPVPVATLPLGAGPLSLGSGFSCSKSAAGARCWGNNQYGQVGAQTTPDRDVPAGNWVENFNAGTAVAQIASGYEHSCLRTSTSLVWCWGNNGSGKLGNGSNQSSFKPVPVAGTYSAVGVGYYHSCAIASQGGASCWGNGYFGQLGNLATVDSAVPVTVQSVAGSLSGVTRIAGGSSHTCAIAAGNVYCWGNAKDGRLGYLTPGDFRSPAAQPVQGLPPVDMEMIAAGETHTCALEAGGKLWCWGSNDIGETGTRDSGPVPEAMDFDDAVSDLSLGSYYSCAISLGVVYCWGNNDLGTLGDGTVTHRNTPTKVVGLPPDAISISAGPEHACATFLNGTQYCWGNGMYGRLGNLKPGYAKTVPAEPILFRALFANGFE